MDGARFRKLSISFFQDNEQYKDKMSVNCSVPALIDRMSFYILRQNDLVREKAYGEICLKK